MTNAGATSTTFFGKYAPWFFVAVAGVITMMLLIPADVMAGFNSDSSQIPLLWRDLFVNGGHLRDWSWGGHSDLFPDVLLGFALAPFTGGGLLTLQVSACVLCAVLVSVLALLYRQSGGRNVALFTAGVLLLVAGLVDNFGIGRGVKFGEMFINNIHGGMQIMTLLCVALAQRAAFARPAGLRHDTGAAAGECGAAFWLFTAVCFLTAASDLIFLTIFTIPFLLALVITRLAWPDRVRCFIPLVCGTLGASALGLLAGSHLFAAQLNTGDYLQFTGARVVSALAALRDACPLHVGGDFAVLLVLDAVFVSIAAWRVVASLRKNAPRRMPPELFLPVAFGALMILCNWSSTLLSGNYSGISDTRYVRLSLLLPLFFALAYGISRIPARGDIAKAACIALTLAATAIAILLPPGQGSGCYEARRIFPRLRSAMEKEAIGPGLAEYWHANMMTLLSGDTVKLRSVGRDGSFYFWVNNKTWFTGSGSSAPPAFRMIYMAALDPGKIRARYGGPSRIIPTGARGQDIWIYPPEREIRYNPICGDLTNDAAYATPGQYNATASSLPSHTGLPEGPAVVAIEGRDQPGYLTYGPYLHPSSGRYRVAFTYTYTATPASGKLVHCDILLWNNTGPIPLGDGDLPCPGTTRHEFTRDIRVSNPTGGALEARSFYRGSGGIRLESLKITYLGALE